MGYIVQLVLLSSSLANKQENTFSVPSDVVTDYIMASQAAAMASMPSSLHPTGFAEMILTFTIILDVVCFLAVGLRTWQRVKERSFWVHLLFPLCYRLSKIEIMLPKVL